MSDKPHNSKGNDGGVILVLAVLFIGHCTMIRPLKKQVKALEEKVQQIKP